MKLHFHGPSWGVGAASAAVYYGQAPWYVLPLSLCLLTLFSQMAKDTP